MIVILLVWGGCFLVGTAYSDTWGRMLYALSDMVFIFASNHFLIKQEPVDAFVMQSMSNDEPMEESGQVVSEVPEIIDNSKLEQTLQKHVIQQELFLKPDLSIDDVAREIGTNIKYLSFFLNNFKKTNFNQYINDLRLDYAIKLMEKHPETTLGNVYIRSGFNTASTFGRVFRDRYGMSPSEYAEKLKHVEQPEEETTLVASKQQLLRALEGENSINEFYIQFAQYYPNFLNQLKQQVSNLSPKEFVLCAMVYCEIDNALQAKTLGLTRESLRVTKSRINTKLNPNREHPTLLHALRAIG